MTGNKIFLSKDRRSKMIRNLLTATNSSLILHKRRSKFWFLILSLFILWYILLYFYDSSFTTPQNHESSIEISYSTLIHLSNKTDTISNNTIETTNTKSVYESESYEDDLINNVDQIQHLEKDLEPLLNGDDESKSCLGRYVYIHQLPEKFNEELIKQCKLLNQWSDMCQYMMNNGLGQNLGNPHRLFLPTGWFSTSQFSLEIIFHNRLKQYECLTNDSSKASAVFVPYYAGLDVARYLWGFNVSRRDADSLELAKMLREKPEWKVMYGRDHFMVAGRITWDFRRGVDEDSAWGNKLMLLPEFKNSTILTIESSPWNLNDFAIPYPTYFHPSDDDEVFTWQSKMRRQKRKILFSFAGGARPHLNDSIREEIITQCIGANRKCRMIECRNKGNKCHKPIHVMKLFQNSIFCLQPPGDSFTRRSTFDSILAGCIPVFFTPGSAYVQYIWHLPREFSKYSVLIPEDELKIKKVNIERWLSGIPKEEVLEMREEVIKLIPKVVYADPRSKLETSEDAFDLTLKGVIERVDRIRKEIREGWNNSLEIDEESSWKYNLFGIVGTHEWDHFFLRTNRNRY